MISQNISKEEMTEFGYIFLKNVYSWIVIPFFGQEWETIKLIPLFPFKSKQID